MNNSVNHLWQRIEHINNVSSCHAHKKLIVWNLWKGLKMFAQCIEADSWWNLSEIAKHHFCYRSYLYLSTRDYWILILT